MTAPGPGSPLQTSTQTIAGIMQLVLLALVPGIAMATWFFGFGILINILLAGVTAIALEAAILKLRKKDIRLHLGDYSALVSAVLFAIAVPPGSPWWLVIIGIVFALVFAKHMYGGLGQNPFNPAMCGYVLLLLAFPLEMTTWHIPNEIVNSAIRIDSLGIGDITSDQQILSPFSWLGLQQSLVLTFPFIARNSQQLIDGLAMATPLIEFKMAGHSALLTAWDNGLSWFDRESATGWELINIAYLGGGLLLLYKRIISWHIPFSILLTIGVISSLFYAPDSAAIYGTPYLHLFGSATMIAAFFIATDPVSAATSNRGRIIYGILIGTTIYSIRVWGSYLDSIALAVLFGNFCAPLLDYYCRPRRYGHLRRGLVQRPNQATEQHREKGIGEL
ncbi:MAG: RnfABCDGE type electron transport complex subunit D [Pseudohongiella sp.]|jgi:Na+-translocating ferredoxin:NAD+ oxidoreductase subunit D|nr:RnfABCDGE type electron transport complex subunit D [Pseudohongiella sp.]